MARVEIDGGGEGGEGILTISIKCRGLVKGYEGFFFVWFWDHSENEKDRSALYRSQLLVFLTRTGREDCVRFKMAKTAAIKAAGILSSDFLRQPTLAMKGNCFTSTASLFN